MQIGRHLVRLHFTHRSRPISRSKQTTIVSKWFSINGSVFPCESIFIRSPFEFFLQMLFEGSLSKWTNVIQGWQYRYFVLDANEGTLVYYTVSSSNNSWLNLVDMWISILVERKYEQRRTTRCGVATSKCSLNVSGLISRPRSSPGSLFRDRFGRR